MASHDKSLFMIPKKNSAYYVGSPRGIIAGQDNSLFTISKKKHNMWVCREES